MPEFEMSKLSPLDLDVISQDNPSMTRRPAAEKHRLNRASRTEGTGNLGERAYQQIRTEILFYQLPPGSRVSAASSASTE
jgi:hypothetical protein